MISENLLGENTLLTSNDIVRNAFACGTAILSFNVPYLPMVEPVVGAILDQDSFAFIETARLEWIKFAARGPKEVLEEFRKWEKPSHVRLHLDHIPVIDEDRLRVGYQSILQQAIDLGYASVMVDGSRLPFDENIAATQEIVAMAHRAGIACEAELGAVLGHESGASISYEEMFASGYGFTQAGQASQFVQQTACDWLSVAIGNIHGPVSGALKDAKKVEAHLNLDHLDRLREAAGVPLVLHGGSGVRREDVRAAMRRGIAKINVGMEIRQAYESAMAETGRTQAAQQNVYERTCWLIRDYFQTAGINKLITGQKGSLP